MQSDPKAILKQYWGYKDFRDPQQEIINSVLEGKDTLALMPTGSGKSICFQVPAMMHEGLCLVITPLIALMQDQVRQLWSLDIKAVAIHAGMSRRDIDIQLDNCVYGKIKFLYVSPERLQTELFLARAVRMNINLIVVDEAHCISEWGYDFRPAYLEIANLRPLLGPLPMLALTATATPVVRDDILAKLDFADHRIFQISFKRDNLQYSVKRTEDKQRMLKTLLQQVSGSALVYVNTRKGAREISGYLQKLGFSASYYHGGLSTKDRSMVQDHWLEERSRVMVATNAFGMGINKSNVRAVIHYDLPYTLEGYYQESGRAGRDGQPSIAVLLYQPGDFEILMERKANEYPEPHYLQEVYGHLANYYQLAVGSVGAGEHDFVLEDFASTFGLKPLQAFHALRKLQLLGLISLTEDFFQPSQFQFTVDHQQVYEFQIANAFFDPLIKALLRLYGGELFSRRMNISEPKLAATLETSTEKVRSWLSQLQQRELGVFQPQKEKPQLSFLGSRQAPNGLTMDKKAYQTHRKSEFDKLKAVEIYLNNNRRCRSLQLLEYFGEISYEACGKCDVCRSDDETERDHEKPFQAILQELHRESLTPIGLVSRLPQFDQDHLAKTIQMMLENQTIMYDKLGRLALPSERV